MSAGTQIIRGPILNPRPDGRVDFLPDGALMVGADGRLLFVGEWLQLQALLGSSEVPIVQSEGILAPPFLDCHTHIPQYPIRGHFIDGLPEDLREGRLLAGLERNVFPQEGRCGDAAYAEGVVHDFAAATLAQGIVGGAAYMTVHTSAARSALRSLPTPWSVGLVLMDQYCPSYLRTNEAELEQDFCSLASEFGSRLIVTDRFAVSVGTPLRRRGVELSVRLGLRMQTHLNEQRAEKALVENVLYPDYAGYTDVYRQDGLLARSPIMAHCIQMRPEEWEMVAQDGVAIAHCPTSNTLLGSGTMPLDEVVTRRLPYALCTDVGASPTPSLLAEMAQFLKVHQDRSEYATPSEALFRVTLAPAQILGLDREIGSFEEGKQLSYVEIARSGSDLSGKSANEVIWEELLDSPSTLGLEQEFAELAATGHEHGDALERLTADVHTTARRLDEKVLRVILAGKVAWQRTE